MPLCMIRGIEVMKDAWETEDLQSVSDRTEGWMNSEGTNVTTFSHPGSSRRRQADRTGRMALVLDERLFLTASRRREG